jgi:hypothetical protein
MFLQLFFFVFYSNFVVAVVKESKKKIIQQPVEYFKHKKTNVVATSPLSSSAQLSYLTQLQRQMTVARLYSISTYILTSYFKTSFNVWLRMDD